MPAFALAIVLVVAPQEQPSIDARIAALTARIEPPRLERTVRDLVGFGTRHVRSATGDPARGTGAARSYLEQKLGELVPLSGGRLSVERRVYRVPSERLGTEVELVDIVARLRGTADRERVYVVGGHYDSINADRRDAEDPAPGANDDASGTAVVLEACRVLCATPFAATILFCCYDGEEMGLLGSTAHAAELSEAGVLVDGMITNDIVGNTLGMDGVRRGDYLRCFSYAPRGNDTKGRSLARAASFAARHVPGFRVMLVQRGDRYGRGGDHRPFFQQGYPAIRFTEPREDYSRQHQDVTERQGAPYGDLPEWVDFDYVARVCAVNVALLAELASAPRPPERVQVRGARDAYDAVLSWQPVAGASGYEAVWRLTTAPDWEQAAVVADASPDEGGALRFALCGVCLDDAVVGVRSVGADGSRSRVSTPPEPDAFDERGARQR